MKNVSIKTLLFYLLCMITPPTTFAATCQYVVVHEWNSGFTAAVRITNDGSSPVSGWEVNWEYSDGSTVTRAWNAALAGNNPYTATPLSWNNTINPGATIEIGLQGEKGQVNTPAQVPQIAGTVCEDDTDDDTDTPPDSELPALTLERIYPNLSLTEPTTMVQSPDGSRWFILEKRGLISWVPTDDNTVSTTNTYIDLTAIVDENVEGGLLDMAFHPDFANNGEVFLSFTENAPADSDASLISVIARYSESSDGARLVQDSREDILTLEQPFNNHNGGQIRFGPDGYLYISFGDGGSANDPFNNGQNPDNLFGTIVRIDVDSASPYAIPPDNPFVNGGGAPEVFAYGLRNPWRFSFDSETGELWAGDVGQASFEEINIIESGGNYGWRCREGFEATANECTTSGPYIDPLLAYGRDKGEAITGGFVYRGDDIPGLEGYYVFGDYAFGTVSVLTEPSPGNYAQEVLIDSDLLISSFAQDINGELYAVDISGDALYRIVGEDGDSPDDNPDDNPDDTPDDNPDEPEGSAVNCSVNPTNVWNSGYQLDVVVTNSSDNAINGWEVAMSFVEPPQVSGSWNADLSVSENTITAVDVGWNGNLQPAQSASFGFRGEHDGSFVLPECVGAQ